MWSVASDSQMAPGAAVYAVSVCRGKWAALQEKYLFDAGLILMLACACA